LHVVDRPLCLRCAHCHTNQQVSTLRLEWLPCLANWSVGSTRARWVVVYNAQNNLYVMLHRTHHRAPPLPTALLVTQFGLQHLRNEFISSTSKCIEVFCLPKLWDESMLGAQGHRYRPHNRTLCTQLITTLCRLVQDSANYQDQPQEVDMEGQFKSLIAKFRQSKRGEPWESEKGIGEVSSIVTSVCVFSLCIQSV
jgi:hypothetical protein